MYEKLKVTHCCSFLVLLLILTASCTLGYKWYSFLSSSINSVYTLCFVRRNSDLLSSYKVAVTLEREDYFCPAVQFYEGISIAEELSSELYVAFFKFKIHLHADIGQFKYLNEIY